jgi:hypothetical protein
LATVVALAGASLLAPVAVAVATPAVASAATLSVDINGSWTDIGSAKPRIAVSGSTVTIDMSYAGRSTATGPVTGASTFAVTFPGAGTFSATVVNPTLIRWSNGSTWQKVYTGGTVASLYRDDWQQGVTTLNPDYPTTFSGYIDVRFDNGRPDGVGFVLDSSRIQVTFPDDATYQARLDPSSGFLVWSNDSVWTFERQF